MPVHTLIIWLDVGAGFTAKAFSRTRIGSGASDPSHKGFLMSSHLFVMSASLTRIRRVVSLSLVPRPGLPTHVFFKDARVRIPHQRLSLQRPQKAWPVQCLR